MTTSQRWGVISDMETITEERTEVAKPVRFARLRRVIAGGIAAGAAAVVGLVSAGGTAFAQSTPPDPTTIGTNLANSAGNSLLNVAVAVIPVLVVVLAGFWAIRLVLHKLGLGHAKV